MQTVCAMLSDLAQLSVFNSDIKIFFWKNVEKHPSGAAPYIQNLCQGTLKLF